MRKLMMVLLLSFALVGGIGSAGTTTQSNDELNELDPVDLENFKRLEAEKGHMTLWEYVEFMQCNHPSFIKMKEDAYKREQEKRQQEIGKFLEELAWKESRCNWKVVNCFGYMGKYQFGKAVLKGFKLYPQINSRDFKRNPYIFPEKLQDSLVVELMHKNKAYLNRFLEEHRGDSVAGFYINDPAVLGAAHLVGMGNMRKFFESNGKKMPKDGNGVTAGDYMEHFGKFDFVL